MELSKYIKSESVELNRSAIHFADYNPRKLSEESRKTLKRGIKKFGLVGGIVVNKRTGLTVVSGISVYPSWMICRNTRIMTIAFVLMS